VALAPVLTFVFLGESAAALTVVGGDLLCLTVGGHELAGLRDKDEYGDGRMLARIELQDFDIIDTSDSIDLDWGDGGSAVR